LTRAAFLMLSSSSPYATEVYDPSIPIYMARAAAVSIIVVIMMAISITGCVSPTRFAPTPVPAQATPQQPQQRPPLPGPYERTPADGTEPYSPAVRP
jgi:hypothetical protein